MSPQRIYAYIRERGASFALGMILAVYFAAGVSGIFFDFGNAAAIGDETVITATVLKMFAHGTLIPADQYNYHMPLPMYLYAPLFAAVLAGLRVLGVFHDLSSLVVFGIVDWPKLLPLARFISVLCGMGALALLFATAKRVFGSVRVALLSTALLASSLLFTILSHFGRVWLPQMLALMFALYAIALLYTAGSKFKHYIMAGAAIALSFGAHVIGVLAYVPFLVAHFLKMRGAGYVAALTHRGFLAATGIVIASAPLWYVLNPLGLGHYVSGVITGIGTFFGGAPIAAVEHAGTISDKFFFYGRTLLEYEPVLLLLSVPGCILLYLRMRDWFFILGSFIVVYYAAISALGGGGLEFEQRFIAPAVPVLALCAAYALSAAYEALSVKGWRAAGVCLIAALLALSATPALMWTYRFNGAYTTVEARTWVMEHAESGSRILYFDWSNPIALYENEAVLKDIARFAPEQMTTGRTYLLEHPDLFRGRVPAFYVMQTSYFWKKDVPAALPRSFDYVIVSFWDEKKKELARMQMAQFGIDVSRLIPVAAFPQGATLVSSGGFSIEEPLFITSHPILDLALVNEPGPVILIYKVSR